MDSIKVMDPDSRDKRDRNSCAASVYLKGFGKHEDSDIVGRGFNRESRRGLRVMKWIGANSFRTSHYPYSEEIYMMADRRLPVIDEVPAVGLLTMV